jgi:hypothetical protein
VQKTVTPSIQEISNVTAHTPRGHDGLERKSRIDAENSKKGENVWVVKMHPHRRLSTKTLSKKWKKKPRFSAVVEIEVEILTASKSGHLEL